jgi:16S rRNA (uracil1498-N3)-methyltransferase
MGWPADVPAAAHLFVDSAAALTDVLQVGGEDGHHLGRVLRLRAGETVTVADGSGSWRPYRIRGAPGDGAGPAGAARAGPRAARGGDAVISLDAAGPPDEEAALCPSLAVAFALTKGDKPDLVVQKLTELGVDRILPVLAERSVVRLDGPRAAAAVDRWRRIVREAAGQCRRATLPVVEPLGPLPDLAGHPGLVVAERGSSPAADLGPPPGGELLVVVGPEGGLAEAEVAALRPWARLDLGPHILRAETAAIAAAAVLSAVRHAAP